MKPIFQIKTTKLNCDDFVVSTFSAQNVSLKKQFNVDKSMSNSVYNLAIGLTSKPPSLPCTWEF